MLDSSEPLFKSAMRAMLVSAFGLLGLLLGLMLFAIPFSFVGKPEGVITPKTTFQIAPNVNGTRSDLRSESDLILMIEVNGVIGSEFINAPMVETVLTESQGTLFDEGRVKGIFVEINSPGGTVFDSDNIYRQIKRYKEKYNVPVVAFVNGLCASGGMYVASAADQIYASDVSLVGSVGVILNSFLNVSKLLERWGIESKTVVAGNGKDAMNPLRPWKEGEADDFQHLTNHYYMQFLEVVTSNRPLIDREKLIYEYGARIFPAAEAADYGFIDGVGYDYQGALNVLVEAAELSEDEYQVVKVSTRNWWNEFVQGNFGLLHGKVTHHLELGPYASNKLASPFLYLYQP